MNELLTPDYVKERYKIHLNKQKEIRIELDIELSKIPPTTAGTRSRLIYTETEFRKVLQRVGFRKVVASDVGDYVLDSWLIK